MELISLFSVSLLLLLFTWTEGDPPAPGLPLHDRRDAEHGAAAALGVSAQV